MCEHLYVNVASIATSSGHAAGVWGGGGGADTPATRASQYVFI